MYSSNQKFMIKQQTEQKQRKFMERQNTDGLLRLMFGKQTTMKSDLSHRGPRFQLCLGLGLWHLRGLVLDFFIDFVHGISVTLSLAWTFTSVALSLA